MAEALNAHCFSQPHWELIARGIDTAAHYDEGRTTGEGGMFSPQKTHLKLGQRYYRFAGHGLSEEATFGGAWWMEFETFAMIRAFAAQHGHNLIYAARLFLALPPAWTSGARLVTAFLERPLMAYAGPGRPASAGAETFTPLQHLRAKQLFIPGLQGEVNGQKLFRLAFSGQKIEFAATTRLAGRAGA